jgi:hypothetical protein
MATEALTFQIPHSLKVEHDELHAELARATKESGEIGAAAREVARLLHPHFVKEEEFALPPLGVLAAVAAGSVRADMQPAIEMTRRLKSELREMVLNTKGSSPRSRSSGKCRSRAAGATSKSLPRS